MKKYIYVLDKEIALMLEDSQKVYFSNTLRMCF